ncbi:ornithine cyclodeaminase [Salsuginibacillus halophilus]|uniref:Ornithine cyclodeaminase n=1 Tax=Salsuginibacillus halophilus TaxID=517424 RepID=A0A2P8HHY8_9BACI|nr:cyclodeaminase [Salsuginibacillus halophilus]PSL45842.1 ornithine cyclodeaminase [Salsuginibacillus halophilus]
MLMFREEEIRAGVKLDDQALEAVETAFRTLATGNVSQPPVARVDIPEENGEADIKTAYIEGFDGFAVKVSTGFFNNETYGLPSLGGLMMLFSTKTGQPKALLQDNGYLTDVRTGLAGAVAAKHLAPANVKTAGVLGTGMQARMQIEALQLVRSFEQVLVYGRRQEKAEAYQKEMEEKLGCPVKVVTTMEEVVKGSEVVVTTTPATAPYLKPEWLHSNLHITAVGSDAPDKQELEVGVFEKADIAACDVWAQSKQMGEGRAALEAGVLHEDTPLRELGAIIAGLESTRSNESAITVCDLTGTGVQDTAIAMHAYQALKKSEE